MKKACFDTDFLVALLRNHPDAVKRTAEYDSVSADISTTSMNAFEIYLGAFRAREAARNVRQAEELLNSIKILDLTLESSRKSGEILSQLFHMGATIGLRDAIIAGIVLVNGYTLVTRNTGHFRRVTGLTIDTW